MLHADAKIHPTIKRCLKHLQILGADHKTRQIVYMYMETLVREVSLAQYTVITETTSDFGKNQNKN
ncbi:hypothetical protein [Bacillus sp. V5-8f]|uniref:hypothetical protein n=1 Tax=Bacillus sp. V5-8f TaxID=2053044 RepID=UPI000C793F70|nr:hypothetical protein [Bacillus sp. V5-8f]PLT33720.1 hypothetical protein CUU64_11420 [Bacillus sp. V5-8f]